MDRTAASFVLKFRPAPDKINVTQICGILKRRTWKLHEWRKAASAAAARYLVGRAAHPSFARAPIKKCTPHFKADRWAHLCCVNMHSESPLPFQKRRPDPESLRRQQRRRSQSCSAATWHLVSMATERLALAEQQVGGAARMRTDLAVSICSSGNPGKRAADFSNVCSLCGSYISKTSIKRVS